MLCDDSYLDSVVNAQQKTVVHDAILCQELNVSCQSLQQFTFGLFTNLDLGSIIEKVHIFQCWLFLLSLLV